MIIDLFQSIFGQAGLAGLLAALTLLLPAGMTLNVTPSDVATATKTVQSEPSEDVFAVPAGFTATADTVYPLCLLNLRTGPSLENDILTVLPQNMPIRRLAADESGWSLVRYREFEGYC